MKKTVLVTTNWDSGTYDELCKRENEMKEEHWRSIIQKEGKVHRFLRNGKSAWDIINILLLQCADIQGPLLLQKQLVDDGLPFSETEAGRHAISAAEKKKDGRKRIMGVECVIQ